MFISQWICCAPCWSSQKLCPFACVCLCFCLSFYLYLFMTRLTTERISLVCLNCFREVQCCLTQNRSSFCMWFFCCRFSELSCCSWWLLSAGLIPYNFLCVQGGLVVSQLQSVSDLFSVPILLGMVSMAAASLVPGFLVRKPLSSTASSVETETDSRHPKSGWVSFESSYTTVHVHSSITCVSAERLPVTVPLNNAIASELSSKAVAHTHSLWPDLPSHWDIQCKVVSFSVY